MSIAHKLEDKDRTDDVLISEAVDFPGLLLSKPVLKGLTDGGFLKPSPIQLKAIPLGRCGLDLIVQAKSGTGKTCVFTVIALESVDVTSLSLQVLVLAPTREIAQQIHSVIREIGSAMPGLKCHTFIGGMPILQDKILCKRCHIAVGTPGRVKQLVEIGALKVNSIRLFVLDEADKLLESSFQESINWIYSILPDNKQILALSATYPEYLAQHLTRYMRNPTFVRLNASDPALLGIKQYHVIVPHHPMPNVVFNAKTETVVKIISSVSFQQCLIFSNMQTRAQDLQSELQARNWPTACIAGCLQQQERTFAMDQLKSYKCRILISTDLTSRGIDADKVNLVINLDVPPDHETYLHRIGRAGRFGSFGAAITIVSRGVQEKDLWRIEKQCKTYIHKLPDPMPNDLVTRPVPVRLDDVVSTEKIINCSEPEAAKGCVDSEQAGKQAKAPEKDVKDDQASPSLQAGDNDHHFSQPQTDVHHQGNNFVPVTNESALSPPESDSNLQQRSSTPDTDADGEQATTNIGSQENTNGCDLNLTEADTGALSQEDVNGIRPEQKDTNAVEANLQDSNVTESNQDIGAETNYVTIDGGEDPDTEEMEEESCQEDPDTVETDEVKSIELALKVSNTNNTQESTKASENGILLNQVTATEIGLPIETEQSNQHNLKNESFKEQCCLQNSNGIVSFGKGQYDEAEQARLQEDPSECALLGETKENGDGEILSDIVATDKDVSPFKSSETELISKAPNDVVLSTETESAFISSDTSCKYENPISLVKGAVTADSEDGDQDRIMMEHSNNTSHKISDVKYTKASTDKCEKGGSVQLADVNSESPQATGDDVGICHQNCDNSTSGCETTDPGMSKNSSGETPKGNNEESPAELAVPQTSRPVARAKRKPVNRSFALSGFLEQLKSENDNLNSLAAAKGINRNSVAEKDSSPSDAGISFEANRSPKKSDVDHELQDSKEQSMSPVKPQASEEIPQENSPASSHEKDMGNGKSYSRSREAHKVSSSSEENYQHPTTSSPETKADNYTIHTQVFDTNKKSESFTLACGSTDGVKTGSFFNLADNEITRAKKSTAEHTSQQVDTNGRLIHQNSPENFGHVSDEVTVSCVKSSAEKLKRRLESPWMDQIKFHSSMINVCRFSHQSTYFEIEKTFQIASKSFSGNIKISANDCKIFHVAENFSNDPPELQAYCKSELERVEALKLQWLAKRDRAGKERLKSTQDEVAVHKKRDNKLALEGKSSSRPHGFLSDRTSTYGRALLEHVKHRERKADKSQARRDEDTDHSEDFRPLKGVDGKYSVKSKGKNHEQPNVLSTQTEPTDDLWKRSAQQDPKNEECKQLDEMHEEMLRKRKLRKATKKNQLVGNADHPDLKLRAQPIRIAPGEGGESVDQSTNSQLKEMNNLPSVTEGLGKTKCDFMKDRTNNATQNYLPAPGKPEIQSNGMEESGIITSKNENVDVEKFKNTRQKSDSLDECLEPNLEAIHNNQGGLDSNRSSVDQTELATQRTPVTGRRHPHSQTSAKKCLTPLFDAVHAEGLNNDIASRHGGGQSPMKCTVSSPFKLSKNHKAFNDKCSESEYFNQHENASKEKQFLSTNHNVKNISGRSKRRQVEKASAVKQEKGQVCRIQHSEYLSSEESLPTKPSRSAARLAGLEVSDGPTSSSSELGDSCAGNKAHGKAYISASSNEEDGEGVSDVTSQLDSSSDDPNDDSAYHRNYPSYPSTHHHPWYPPPQYQVPYSVYHQYWQGSSHTKRNGSKKSHHSGPSYPAGLHPWYSYHQYYPYHYGPYPSLPPLPPPPPFCVLRWYYHYGNNFQVQSFSASHQRETLRLSLQASMQWKYVCQMTKQSIRLAKKLEKTVTVKT